MNISKKRVNIKELAKKLNLSVSSISRGLNGHKNISEATRKKILKLAKKYVDLELINTSSSSTQPVGYKMLCSWSEKLQSLIL